MTSPRILFLAILAILGQQSSCTNTTTKIFNLDKLRSKIMDTMENTDDNFWLMLKMIDASTKIPSGLLAGSFFDLGNFDECYDIHSGEIYGKYCLGMPKTPFAPTKTNLQNHIKPIHPQPLLAGLGPEYMGLHVSVCVPSILPAKDIPSGPLWKFTEDFCYSKDTIPKITGGAIATIVIIGGFLAIALFSTIFDVYLHYSNKKAPHDLLIAFSFFSNGKKLIAASSNPDQLLCLNGIKSISMMWVIIGHVYSLSTNSTILNYMYLLTWEKKVINMMIVGATVSVDTFFVVGGLVTVYTYLRSMEKGVKFNIFLYYLHRYLRLTPALAIIALFNANLAGHFGNGPLWKLMDTIVIDPCRNRWWGTLFYIGNFLDQDKGFCVGQSWYLSVDMQLFVLSPLILIPLKKWPRYALGAIAALIVAGVVVPFTIGYVNNLGSMLYDGRVMKLYYIHTYTRFGPYVIGMLLGYFVYKIKRSSEKITLKPTVVMSLWVISLAGLASCVFAGYNLGLSKEEHRLGNSFFLGFNRNGWAVALSIMIFLCVSGYGGPVDAFLSHPIFQFLTKLSYSMYLVHFGYIATRYSSLKNTYKFSNLQMMHDFWGDFMFTLAISIVFCLTFESPVIILEKFLFGKGGRSPPQRKG